MIKMQVIGHLGRDCNVNTVNGKSVINFSVAHSEKYKDGQGTEINKTTWVSCAFWIERSGLTQYLTKGMQVYVEGTPDVHTYRAQDGQWRSDLRLRVQDLKLLGHREQRESQQPAATTWHTYQPISGNSQSATELDDLPF